MKQVFLDANTLVSGIVFSGPEHELLKKGTLRKLELITSEDVIEELAEVISRKFPSKAYLLKEFLKLAEIRVVRKNEYADAVEKQTVRDPEDKHVLAAAIASRCDTIVTGDQDLLVLKTYRNIRIAATKELLRAP